MDRDKHEHVQELMEEVARELGYEWEERKASKREQPGSDPKRYGLWIVAVIGAAIVVLVLALHTGKQSNNNKAYEKALEARLQQMENRISEIEKTTKAIAKLPARIEKLQSQLGGVETSIDSLSARMDKLSRSARGPKKTTATTRSKARGIKIHVVRRGDTLYGIASRYGVKAKSICLANGITLKTTLHPGQKLTIPSK